ncbi:ATP phosphoribosyltransferase [Alicyclobacillus sp. ALC3]|uniref:ATP phosphoribosyltransferase n=1 Tax=Alicyclobacillus sp. ALC3 TaxID=2796143 RepID=UPI0023782D19|nr:ATP phosphoribosyltransferase [Alicyclobacillus sp. ALC3]WDL98266.1 ATP phosphoribosyltransferase [Alicyclobacillus sp. ALC3]
MLTVALAKGRTADDLMPMWRRANLPAPESLDDSRALVFDVQDERFGVLRILLAKPADVPAYVSLGVADVGVAGKDVLLESDREVYELLDLGVARCKLCVAGRPQEQAERPRRVATKYPKLADAHFRRLGQQVEIVGLSGSIELAAVIGLADRIVDLVQSGKTLEANGLVVFEELLDISARLIANRSSYRMKRRQIDVVWQALENEVKFHA